MKKLYITLFCRFYSFVKEDFRAMCILSLLISLNIFTIIGYYKTIIEQSSQFMLPTLYEGMIVVAVGTFNYAYFLHNKNYEPMYEVYKNDVSMSGKSGKIATAIYIIFTPSMLISLIWLARMNIRN